MTLITVLRGVCLAAFAVNACLHLFWKKHGNMTKALILPTILLCYLTTAQTVSPVIIGAAAAAWAGDVLLMKSGFRWFTAGGIAFMLGHMLFGLSYLPFVQAGAVSVPLTAGAAVLYCAVSFVTVWCIRGDTPKNTNGLLLVYLLTNAFMNVLALAVLQSNHTLPGVMIFAGALLFFISDNALFFECFHHKKPNLFITVMGTYIAGVFLIMTGSALMG